MLRCSPWRLAMAANWRRATAGSGRGPCAAHPLLASRRSLKRKHFGWMDAGCTAGGNPGGNGRHRGEEQGGQHEREWVQRLDTKQQCSKRPCCGVGASQPERDSESRPSGGLLDRQLLTRGYEAGSERRDPSPRASVLPGFSRRVFIENFDQFPARFGWLQAARNDRLNPPGLLVHLRVGLIVRP